MSVAKSYTPLIPMPGMSGYRVRAPVHSTRLRAVNRRPSTSTVRESMILAGVFRMNSMSSCSLDCQFMMACGYIRPALNRSTISWMLARFSSNGGYHRRPAMCRARSISRAASENR